MGCGVGRAVVSFRVLGTGGGCVVGKKEGVKLNSESSSPGRVPKMPTGIGYNTQPAKDGVGRALVRVRRATTHGLSLCAREQAE